MSRLRDTLSFLLLSVLWGLSFPAIAVGLSYMPPLFFAALRYDVAAIGLLGYLAIQGGRWLPTGRNNLIAIAGGGLFLVAGNGLLFIGQQTVPSGVAAIIQALVPIATAIWALVLLGERLSRLGAVGVIVGFLGISLVVQPDPTNLLAGDTVGRLIIIGQVISVSLGGVLVQRAQPTLGRISLTGWSMVVGAVVLHIVSAVVRETPTAETFAPTAIIAVIYLGVFSTAIAFFIYYTILEEHGAFEAGLVTYLVPIVSTTVGVAVLGESISILTFVGFGLVAVGFVLLKRDAIADFVNHAPAVGRP